MAKQCCGVHSVVYTAQTKLRTTLNGQTGFVKSQVKNPHVCAENLTRACHAFTRDRNDKARLRNEQQCVHVPNKAYKHPEQASELVNDK
jgi:hypothetical protein